MEIFEAILDSFTNDPLWAAAFAAYIFVIFVVPSAIMMALLKFIKPKGNNGFGAVPRQHMSLGTAAYLSLLGAFEFKGRTARSEFWMTLILTYTLMQAGHFYLYSFFHEFGAIAGIVLYLPFVASAVRRLHDINRSGWWLVSLVFIIPFFALSYLWLQPSQIDEVDVEEVFH